MSFAVDLRKVTTATLGNVWRAVNIELPSTLELQCDSFILQIVDALEVQLLPPVLRLPRLGIEITIMVPSNNNLLSVRQRSNPIQLRLYFLHGACIRKVTGVDHHVAMRNRQGVGVCV